MDKTEAIALPVQQPKGFLALPNGTLFIDYNQPAEVYFDFETTPRDVFSRLKFLGAICTVRIAKGKDIVPASAENLQAAGIGRKSLSQLANMVLSCEESRCKILDNAPTIIQSKHFKVDHFDVIFEDSDSDIYQNTVWSKNVDENGQMQAYIDDIKIYCKVNDKRVTDAHIEAKVSEGGIGWFLGAVLLKVSISQGKLDIATPTLCS